MISSDDADRQARMLSEIQRKVLLQCHRKNPLNYSKIADEIGESYERVQFAGRALQKLNLARIGLMSSPSIYYGRANEYSGSAIFLTENGETVRSAVLKLMYG
ncbi:MAG TPA: hypothetical protein VFF84_11300 [Sphingobium sp.]|nr:hypothetical protein [Sphingobium sp.]